MTTAPLSTARPARAAVGTPASVAAAAATLDCRDPYRDPRPSPSEREVAAAEGAAVWACARQVAAAGASAAGRRGAHLAAASSPSSADASTRGRDFGSL